MKTLTHILLLFLLAAAAVMAATALVILVGDQTTSKFGIEAGIAPLLGVGLGLAGAGFLGDMFGGGRSSEYDKINYDKLNMPGYEDRQNRLLGLADGVQNRDAPQAGAFERYGGSTIDQSQQAQFRAGQLGLMSQLQQQAAGQGPSLAGMQLRQATDRSNAQQQGMAASAAPGQGALAARNASVSTGQANSGMAGQAATARMQEQISARQQLAGVMGQGRAQDIGLATNQAQLGQQTGMFNAGQENQRVLANLQAQLRARGMDDAAIQALLGQEMANAGRQQQGGMLGEQLGAQRYGADMGVPSTGEKLMGMGMGVLGLPGLLGK